MLDNRIYKYPDTYGKHFWDNIYNEKWEDGGLENNYIQECINMIPSDKQKLLLDVGCGLGRLTGNFARWFEKIIAIDPDTAHLQEAIKHTNNLTSNFCNIRFEEKTIQQFNTQERFDCIVCSHVIQHITRQAVRELLEKIHLLLKSKGVLILSSTNLIDGEDEFSKVNTISNEYCKLTAGDFDRCVEINDEWMPTRLFRDEDLVTLLKTHGFEIVFLKKYHGYPLIRGDKFICAVKSS